jgi:RhoGEF domain
VSDFHFENHTENIQQYGAMLSSPSASSIYDDQHKNDGRQAQFTQTVHEEDDRRGDAPRLAHRSAEATNHGEYEDLETKRQELIRELCQTEETFVKRLHVFVQFFVLPLRVHNSKNWISGVPSEVARLFDWLEDIMNVHNQMLSALQATRTAQYPVVERVAESIRAFIPRFEVYQPYLVRLADVVSLMERLVQDETSDFGEFLDIQQGAPECDDWSFQMFLNEPVSRLAKYPDFFSVSVSFSHGFPLSSRFFCLPEVARVNTKGSSGLPLNVLFGPFHGYGHPRTE